jgi:hypothetical protein
MSLNFLNYCRSIPSNCRKFGSHTKAVYQRPRHQHRCPNIQFHSDSLFIVKAFLWRNILMHIFYFLSLVARITINIQKSSSKHNVTATKVLSQIYYFDKTLIQKMLNRTHWWTSACKRTICILTHSLHKNRAYVGIQQVHVKSWCHLRDMKISVLLTLHS